LTAAGVSDGPSGRRQVPADAGTFAPPAALPGPGVFPPQAAPGRADTPAVSTPLAVPTGASAPADRGGQLGETDQDLTPDARPTDVQAPDAARAPNDAGGTRPDVRAWLFAEDYGAAPGAGGDLVDWSAPGESGELFDGPTPAAAPCAVVVAEDSAPAPRPAAGAAAAFLALGGGWCGRPPARDGRRLPHRAGD
jgi:hypothetical protein